jgi:hypothetical protein
VSTDFSEEHIASMFRVEELSSARNQQESKPLASCVPLACLLVSCCTYLFDPEDGGDMFLRNVG